MHELPFSQAAENNQAPILSALSVLLCDARSVLEIGAGTGQHAVHFAAALPHVQWQASEHPDMLARLLPRCEAAKLANLREPIALDMAAPRWNMSWPDALYTANTLHIVGVPIVEALFTACDTQAVPGSQLLVYGPFNYQGEYTAPSNARFDSWLKDRDPRSGIRDFEWVDSLAQRAGFQLTEDREMPANNRLLCWRKA